MKRLLVLLLTLVLALSLVACGEEAAPAEAEEAAPAVQEDVAADLDYDQLLALTQDLIDVEDSLIGIAAMGEDIEAGTVSEEDALAAYADIQEQAVAVYAAVEAAEWQGETYAAEAEYLRQAADAMSLYTVASYEAMANNDAAALEEAAPLLETYMAQMDALLTALEG